jgi:beta-lactamase regulating signal transducer with metallopeptidase domain
VTGIQIVAQLGAERVLNSIPEGLLIAAFAWLVLRVVGRQSAGTRFAVWFVALLAIAALPFIPSLNGSGNVTQGVHPGVTLPASWGAAIFVVWILLAALAATRVLFGLWKLRVVRKNCIAIATSELDPALRNVVEQFATRRRVTICRSAETRVPTAIGFFKPTIVIPEWALQELPAEELKIILLHEFAHLERWDDWTNLAQKVVRTIFFFHPAVWWIEKRLSLEREMACDDVVLAETQNPRAYAECLVSLAEKSFVRRGLAMAQAVISHARETSARLARILDGSSSHSSRVFKPALGIVTVFGAICLAVLPNMPRLVAFEKVAPQIAVASASGTAMTPILPQSAVVPASAKLSGDSAVQLPRQRKLAKATDRAPKLNQVAANQKQTNAPRTQLVRPAVRPDASAPQFLVVMQTTQYDGRGSARSSFCVWRVTFPSGNSNAIQAEVIAKSI